MKEKKHKSNFKFINFILFPQERQKPEEYVQLLSTIFGKKIKIRTYGNRQTFITEFKQIGHNYSGIISSAIFVDPNSKVIDKNSYNIKTASIDPNDGIELKQWTFYFFPKYHRLAIISNCSFSQVIKFFHDAFLQILTLEDSFTVNVETDRGVIDKIIEAKGLTKLIINLSYSNNDNYDDWMNAIDTDIKDSGANHAQFVFKSPKGKMIDLIKTKLIKAILMLSKSNGNAKATIKKAKGKAEIIDTNNHPKIARITYTDNPIAQLEEETKLISENKDDESETKDDESETKDNESPMPAIH